MAYINNNDFNCFLFNKTNKYITGSTNNLFKNKIKKKRITILDKFEQSLNNNFDTLNNNSKKEIKPTINIYTEQNEDEDSIKINKDNMFITKSKFNPNHNLNFNKSNITIHKTVFKDPELQAIIKKVKKIQIKIKSSHNELKTLIKDTDATKVALRNTLYNNNKQKWLLKTSVNDLFAKKLNINNSVISNNTKKDITFKIKTPLSNTINFLPTIKTYKNK
jgi:hypothetical protein